MPMPMQNAIHAIGSACSEMSPVRMDHAVRVMLRRCSRAKSELSSARIAIAIETRNSS